MHLYGANGVKGEFGRLGLGTVADAVEWKRDEGDKWDDKKVVDGLNGWLKDSNQSRAGRKKSPRGHAVLGNNLLIKSLILKPNGISSKGERSLESKS